MRFQQLFVWLSIAAFCCAAPSQADQSVQHQEQIKKWRKVYVNEAKSHQMKVGGFFNKRKLELHPDPLLAYANPAGGKDTHGQFFVWTESGRPAVVLVWAIIWVFRQRMR